MSKKQIHLGYALYTHGTNPAGWMPNPRDYSTDIEYFKYCTRLAEAAKMDMVFRADALFTRMDHVEVWSRYPMHMNALEPIALFSALSQASTHIGLVGTISTTYSQPYVVARQLAALDHVSGGRAGWNCVTSSSTRAAWNFGMVELPKHDERYGRAREYIDVLQMLWDTYEDDAFIHDPQTGYFFDPAKYHPIEFNGKYISVKGGLNVGRPPQGYPVTVQAGGSPQGRQLAAETADVVFSSNRSKKDAQAFYADVKRRTAEAARHPDSLKIMPALTVVVGDSRDDALRKFHMVDDLVPASRRCSSMERRIKGAPRKCVMPLDSATYSGAAHTMVMDDEIHAQ